MSDKISRQAAIDEIREVYEREFPTASGAFDEFVMTMIPNILQNLPSVELERKNGRWSNYKDEHCCSICKCVVISDCWDDEIRYDYCPYCGAEMSEGE